MECVSISFASTKGETQILDGHADGFFKLRPGVVEITTSSGDNVRFSVQDGLISFLDQEDATLLSDSLELLKD